MDTKTSRPRGRPRSEDTRRAIHDAFVEGVVEETYAGLSIDSVAKRANVSRTTIYRWYENKEEIALEVATDRAIAPYERAFNAGYAENIRAFFRRTFSDANAIGQLFTALMAKAQGDPDFAAKLWNSFSTKRRGLLLKIIEENPAYSVYQIRQDAISEDTLLDLIFGSIWYRMMSQHAPLDDIFIDELCALIDRTLGR